MLLCESLHAYFNTHDAGMAYTHSSLLLCHTPSLPWDTAVLLLGCRCKGTRVPKLEVHLGSGSTQRT